MLIIKAADARTICKNEGLPYPLENNAPGVLLRTGAKLNKHRGRYKIYGYAQNEWDVEPYVHLSVHPYEPMYEIVF